MTDESALALAKAIENLAQAINSAIAAGTFGRVEVYLAPGLRGQFQAVQILGGSRGGKGGATGGFDS